MKVSILKKVVELRKNGEKLKALETIKNYLKEDPTDPIANYQCAWCYDTLEQEQEAIPYYLKAIENGLSGAAKPDYLESCGQYHSRHPWRPNRLAADSNG